MPTEPTTMPAANAESGQQASTAVTQGAAPAPVADAKSAAAPADAKATEQKPAVDTVGQATAALVRREQELVKQKQALAKQEADLKEKLSLAEKYQQTIATISKDPLAAAESLGLDYDTLTRLRLERARATISPDDLKRELDARERAAQEAQRKREEDARAAAEAAQAEEIRKAQDDYMADAKSVIDAAPDDYELLRNHAATFGAEKAEALVWKEATEHYRIEREKNPRARPPTAKEAAALAEAALFERGKKLLESKKIAALAAPPKAKPPITLSNEVGASATGRVDNVPQNGDAPLGSVEWAKRRIRELENQSKS